MIEGTTCPACKTHLLIEIGAEIEGKMFEFPSGIKVNFSEARCGIKNVWTKQLVPLKFPSSDTLNILIN